MKKVLGFSIIFTLVFIVSCTTTPDIDEQVTEHNNSKKVKTEYDRVLESLGDKTIKDCDSMINEKDKDRCYRDVAIVTQDLSLCGKVQSSDWKDGCFRIIAEYLKDVTICSNVNHSHVLEVCYQKVAESKKDDSICNMIVNDDTTRKICLLNVAQSNQELTTCDYFENDIDKFYCYKQVAVEKEDITICHKIPTASKDKCYAEIAAKKQDESLCSKIEGDNYNCYMHIAFVTKDKKVCKNIDNVGQRDQCERLCCSQ